MSVQFGSACWGAHYFESDVHIGYESFRPLIAQVSHYVSSSDTFISASLPEVIWFSLSETKFIKTSANVHMEIVWQFLEW